MTVRHEREEMGALMAAGPEEQRRLLQAWGLPAAALLMLESPCRGHCVFCANAGVRQTPLSPTSRALDFARQVRGGLLCVGGNEPATHPAFLEALCLARADRVQVMTSGMDLMDCAESWAASGVHEVAVPIYSRRASVHQSVTGMDHGRLVAGLERARDAGIQVHLHSLALQENLNDLHDLSKWSQALFGRRLVVAPTRAKDDVWDYATQAPALDDVRDELVRADVELIGWPDCVLPDHPRGGAEVIRIYFHGQARVQGRLCVQCSRHASCAGVVEGELRHRGESGLTRM